MAKQAGPIFLIGTFDGVHFYKMNGIYYVRTQSTLDAKTVKTSPRFRNTMKYAAMMGFSSKIASAVFKALPPEFKESWMYRAFVGEAMGLFKQRKPYEEVYAILWKRYAAKYDKKQEHDETETFIHRKELRHVLAGKQRVAPKFNKCIRQVPPLKPFPRRTYAAHILQDGRPYNNKNHRLFNGQPGNPVNSYIHPQLNKSNPHEATGVCAVTTRLLIGHGAGE